MRKSQLPHRKGETIAPLPAEDAAPWTYRSSPQRQRYLSRNREALLEAESSSQAPCWGEDGAGRHALEESLGSLREKEREAGGE